MYQFEFARREGWRQNRANVFPMFIHNGPNMSCVNIVFPFQQWLVIPKVLQLLDGDFL